jgi:hypothetical protein
MIRTLKQAKDAITKAYNERHVTDHEHEFGEVDEFMIQAVLAGDNHCEYDTLNDAIQLGAVDLRGVPTGLVVLYKFNHFSTLDKPIRLELDAMCGGHLTPLCYTEFRHGARGGLTKAVNLLLKRAMAVAEGLGV